jgi:GntR family transcriptional repressor for pyruvate dehydrogenase complex
MFASVDNPLEYLVHDVRFHRNIAQASGNPILAAIMETVTSSIYDRRRRTVERDTDFRESADMHCQIYRAIRAKSPLEARKLMEKQPSHGPGRPRIGETFREAVVGRIRPQRAL